MNNTEKEPYWGSVLFFKHLILGTLLAMIVVPTCLSIFFGIYSYRQGKLIDSLMEELATPAVSTESSTIEVADTLSLTVAPLTTDTPDIGVEVPSYQSSYPEMVTSDPANPVSVTTPTLYLTFDDGPSAVTLDILATLEEKDVIATFFVQGTALEFEQNQEILQMIADAGHTIGIHTYSHNYTEIYASVDAFLDDFYQVWSMVKEITGQEATIFRFPGGSINAYNYTVYQEIISEMLRRGFVYFDWNASSDDAVSGSSSASDILAASINSHGYTRVVLLMHDSVYKSTTAEALPDIIDWYQSAGYQLAPLTNDVTPVVYGYTY